MSRVLPILFNTDMVRAILENRKTVTRRAVKYKYDNTEIKMRTDKYGTGLIEIQADVEGETYGKNADGSTWHKLRPYIEKNPPYRKGDIVYVRETWAFIPCSGCSGDYIRDGGPLNCYDYQAVEYDDGDSILDGCFLYRADYRKPERITWRPSIYMPKQAARIWLRVTNVRVERLQDMKAEDLRKEIGKPFLLPEECESQFDKFGAIYYDQEARTEFSKLWDTVIKKRDIAKYGWMANPWVWVIEFERCEKPESEG